MTEGTVLVLNGTSSSGKTSIVRALQEVLEEPYLDAGIDRFLWMLPKRYLNAPLWDTVLGHADRAGPIGHQLISGMHHAIAAMARRGNCVIVDHVLVEPQWTRECAALFQDLPAFLIGVRCPLKVLEERERARSDRTLGQAKSQFRLVHAHRIYDLEVDTSLLNPDECAGRIKERLQDGAPPTAFKHLRERGW